MTTDNDTSSADETAKQGPSFLVQAIIVIVIATLVGGLAYGIKVSLATSPTTTIDTKPQARAQVESMYRITASTAKTFGASVKSCGANPTCVSAAASKALTSQGTASGMVDLSLYPSDTNAALQLFLDDMVALEKTYLKASEGTRMQVIYTSLLPWPGELIHAHVDSAAVLELLK